VHHTTRRRARTRLPMALAVIAASLAAAGSLAPAASASQAGQVLTRAMAARPPHRSVVKPTVVYRGLRLMGGQTATVFSNGMAEIFGRDRRSVEYRMVPPAAGGAAGTAAALPPKPQLSFDLSRAPAVPYAKGELEVVLAAGVAATAAQRSVSIAELARLRHATARPGAPAGGSVPAYTTSAALNRQLAGLGAASMTQVFRGIPASVLRSLATPAATSGSPLDLARVYTVHVTNASMPVALAALTASPAVAYAAPDWTVSPLDTSPVPMPARRVRAATAMAAHLAAARRQASAPASRGDSGLPPLPGNFGLQSSAQSLLNSTATNWVPAYEALESAYHQLPGTGEVITDVSLGDLTSADIPASDPCSGYESAYGPTTIVKNGQRYLDLPSMPLIPAWTANDSAALDPVGDTCGVDPFDAEIDLDFAMMSPLPHDLQRPDALGSGLTDLLGIAPGASYRLVVPSDTSGSITSVDAAFLAAARQTPRPNVITASLGFGLDSEGMPSRYLEDDPVTQALVAFLTRTYHITVAISANDGLRTATNAAVGPSGGSAATNLAGPGQPPTNLGDVQFSGAPSADRDSGALDAGAATLDDIFAAPPQDPANGTSQQAFPEVRWDGSANFSSGFGSRVNLSAPGDNVLGFEHAVGGTAQSVTVVDNGGTSASVQEVGAAAAVVQQAARLAGDQSVATSPLALRDYLEQTGTPVPDVPQADQSLNVGPQVNVGEAVTGLLKRAGVTVPASVPRVAVAQRQNTGGFGAYFQTATDPTAISLTGHLQNDWLTIAPDWTGLPGAGVGYRLSAQRQDGSEQLLATGPAARLQPDDIIAAAGLQPSAQQPETVTLSYTASAGGQTIAQATVPLTFGPQTGPPTPLAPVVAPVVTGDSFSVHYDLTGQTVFTSPVLVVSAPGRMDPFQPFYLPVYSVPLQGTTGTVQVPVSALPGGGIYGVGIQAAPGQFTFSEFAFTRVQPAPSDAQPAAPLLSAPGQPAGHLLAVPYTGRFSVTWDVRAVPHASGALVEISAPGPTDWNSVATFNNPGGTVLDRNGHDTGSVYSARLTGTSGTITLSAAAAGLDPTMYHNVRVIPLLASGDPAGEASAVSTITRNGVVPADGGAVAGGFGVDAHGSDGLVTSNQVTAKGQTLSSVDTFSQDTSTATGVLASAKGGADQFSTANNGAAAGIFAGDTGLYADTHVPGYATTYQVLSPVARGGGASTWVPPDAPVGAQVMPADNQDTSTDALMIGNVQVGYRVLSTDVKANTFGPSYSLDQALSSFAFPEVTGFGEDTATGTAVVGASDFFNGSAPPTLITIDLNSGALHSYPGVGSGYPLGVAVDSATGTAAMATVDSVGLYDVGNGQAAQVNPGGFSYQHPAADTKAGEFLVEEVAPPGAQLTTPGLGATPDNDSVSSIVVLDQQGRTVSRLEQFNDFNYYSYIIGDYVQVNPATRTGYTLGPGGQQLAPFHY
jgi:hypothetical protein